MTELEQSLQLGDLYRRKQLFQQALNQYYLAVELSNLSLHTEPPSIIEVWSRPKYVIREDQDLFIYRALLSIGEILEGQKNYADAEIAYKQMIWLLPDLPEGYQNLINLYRQEGRSDEILKVLDTAKNLYPNLPFPYVLAGQYSLSIGESQSAIDNLLRARQIDWVDIQIYRLLDTAYNDTHSRTQLYADTLAVIPLVILVSHEFREHSPC